jgi:tetratricopeptide (TPR) repeat protein
MLSSGLNGLNKERWNKVLIINYKKAVMNLYMRFFFLVWAVGVCHGCASDAGSFLEKGKALLQENKPQEALPFLNKAIEKNTGLAEAFNTRGVAYLELKRFQEAQLDFEQAIQIASKDYKPHYNLGRLYMTQGEANLALVAFDKALSLEQQQADLHFDRGNAHFQLGHFGKALADYTAATRLKPYQKDYLYNKAAAHLALQQIDLATKDLETCLQLDSRFAKAHFSLGMLQISRKDTPSGCLHLQQASQLGYEPAVEAASLHCK